MWRYAWPWSPAFVDLKGKSSNDALHKALKDEVRRSVSRRRRHCGRSTTRQERRPFSQS